MKKILYLVAFSFLNLAILNAQVNNSAFINSHFGEKCHTDKNHNELYQNDATYRQNFDAAQSQVRSIINSGVRTGGVYTIPVVVHVMHLGSAEGTNENISDAQIQSAIDNLNDAYANIGYNGLDIEIQFALAVRDPDCNPTDGINRINASGLVSGGDAYATMGATDNNRTALKALSNWNNSDYYNIWIVTEIDNNGGGSGTQGYAYFPGAPNGTDGAVILYNAFGYDPTGSLGYNLKSYTRYNATTIHELGHAFDLYHTFEGDDINDDGTPDTCPSIAAGAGDECGDTDAHRRDDSDCDVIQQTCNGVSNSEVYNNFMAYSSDDCQDRFTADQKTRMRAAIEGPRVSLTTSLGLTPAPSQAPNTLAISCSPVTDATGLGGGFGGIMSVTYGDKTNTTSNAENDGISYGTDGYLDFSNDCLKYLEVNEGDNIPISITTWFNNHNIKVYVDWNHDGEFNETDELALTLATVGTANAGNDMASGNIVMPGTVVTDEYLRIRFNADIASPTGYCDGPIHGQVEDYSIYINPAGASTPVADFTANSTAVCSGGTITFTDASTDATSWDWNFGTGASPATATGQGPHVVTYTGAGFSTVTLDVTGPGGNDSETKTNYITRVSTVVPSVVISSNDADNTICSGTSVTFTAVPTNGGSTPSYQWKLNGGNVGSNSSTYNNSSLSNGDDVSCVMTSNATCPSPTTGTSNTITMTVNSSVTPSVSISASANPINSGDPVTFTATPTNGGSTPSYQWKLNGGNVGSNSSTYNNSSLVNGDQVSCVMTSNATCASPSSATSNTVTMTVNTPGVCSTDTPGPGGVGNQNETKIWLDANQLNLSNNSYVSAWEDRSGNGNDVIQNNTSNKPQYRINAVNNLAAVDFGGNDFMSTGSISDLETNNLSWSVVIYAESYSNGTILSSGYSSGASNNSGHLWKTYISSGNYNSITRKSDGVAPGSINHGTSSNYSILTNVWEGASASNTGYTNGTITRTQNNVNANPSGHLTTRLGARSDVNTSFYNGRIAEVIVYAKSLNSAERIIVDNYLGVKYNIALTSNDIYTYESTHGNDAAGIGMSGGASNNSGRGDIVEISNASSLNDGDFLMFAHDGASTSSTNSGTPSTYSGSGTMMTRVWRADKTNDVGTVTVSFYLDGIATGSSSNFELLIDADGNFANATRVTNGFSYDSGCDIATWTGVSFSDGDYFTIGNPDGVALLQIPISELAILDDDTQNENMEETALEIFNTETEKVEMKLYPNPTTGLLTIENLIEGSQISLYNTIGQLMYNSSITVGRNQFDFSQLNAGIYLVHLKNLEGETIAINQLMISK